MQFALPCESAPRRRSGRRVRISAAAVDFGEIGAHCLDDGLDLARVDAPHAQEAELLPGAAGIVADDGGIVEFRW